MKILNLHTHSEFSNMSCGFEDSINKLERLLDYSFEKGHAGVALTDHESVTGHYRATQWYEKKLSEAKTDEERKQVEDFKLMLGNEIYLAEDISSEAYPHGNKFHHFLLVALDKEGQSQLRQLSSMAWERSFVQAVLRRYNTVAELKEVIGSNPGHVIATTACIASPSGHMFMNKPAEVALDFMNSHFAEMESIFGKDNFFLEIAPYGYTSQIEYNKFLYENFKEKYKFVVTNDVHYLDESEYDTFKVFLGENRSVDEYYKYSHFMEWDKIVEHLSYLPLDFVETAAMNALEVGNRSSMYSLKNDQEIAKVPYEKHTVLPELLEMAKGYENVNWFLNSPHEADRTLATKVLERYPVKDSDIDSPERRKTVFERLDAEWGELRGISEAKHTRVADYLLTTSWMIQVIWDAGSMVGVGRGSAVAFLTNYYLDITEVSPIDYPVHIPHWRFISATRPELPDIDIDTPGSDRELVIQAIRDEYKKVGGGGADVVQVVAYSTLAARKAIRTIGKSLGIADDELGYIASLVKSPRGNALTIKQCYYGYDDEPPVARFVEKMEEHPDLLRHALLLEGLYITMTTHAGGLILSKDPISKFNSVLKSKAGTRMTGNDLHEAEDMGLIKMDALSVDAIGGLKIAIYLLLQNNEIEWKGSLRDTFNFYFHPKKLKPTQETWDAIANGEVTNLFQLNTDVGRAAVKLLNVKSIEEIGMINSLMRLQPQSRGERQPLEIFADHRANPELWYEEMAKHGLSENDVKIMEDHLKILNGVADTQESIMLMSMDERIAGFSVKEANLLRKTIARKDPVGQEKVRQLFMSKGAELGNSKALLNYVWNVQVRYSLGYGFSIPHVAAYSYIALQQAVIYSQYPSIYWNTACLINEAGAFNEEDFGEMIDRGYLKASEQYTKIMEADDLKDVDIETISINRDKIAKQIASFSDVINMLPPNINTSGFGFKPDLETNSILIGLKTISRVGDRIVYEIIKNRPYTSFNDFLAKANVPKDRVVMLIKSGAFSTIESRSSIELLKDYVGRASAPKTVLNGRNIKMLIDMELIPSELTLSVHMFNWWNYLTKNRGKANGMVLMDAPALNFFIKNFGEDKVVYLNGKPHFKEKETEKTINFHKNEMKKFISANEKELLEKVNRNLFEKEWAKYRIDNIQEGEMESLRMYFQKHPLSTLGLTYYPLTEIEEDNFVGEFNFKGRKIPKHFIYHIVGTVVSVDKKNRVVSLLTPEGAIDVKLWETEFLHFSTAVRTTVDGQESLIQDSFFRPGVQLLIFGRKSNDIFFPKIYRDTGVSSEIFKINVKDGVASLEEKLSESDIG